MISTFEVDGKKFYETPIGLLPSVNTILDATTPEEEAKGLEAWRQRTKNHIQISQEAMSRGTVLHELAAEFLGTGQEPTWIDHQIEPYWRSLSSYLQGVSRTAIVSHTLYNGFRKATELPIYHPDLGYAGTLDWMGELTALELTLADFKSSRWYKKPEYTVRYRLQAAAYRLAVEALLELEISQTDIVIAIPKYNPQVIHLTQEQMDHDNVVWLKRLEQFKAEKSNLESN